jgi:phosphate transport system permease protein
MRRSILTGIIWALAGVAACLLLWVVGGIIRIGVPALSWHLLTAAPRHQGAGGGLLPVIWNTLYMTAAALLLSVPVGLGAAILRVEYLGSHSAGARLEEVAELLSSLPSVVIGLGLFSLLIAEWHWPFSRLSGTMALVAINLPWVAASAMGLLKQVPDSFREASLALGATRLRTLTRLLLPSLLPGLVAGLGVGGARLLGESAALLFTAGTNASLGAGLNPMAPGATLAVHLFYVRTEGLMPDANQLAAATGVVLLILLVLMLTLGHGLASALARRAGIR